MITIIHGDDTVSSRKYLIELKTASENSVTLDGKGLTFNDLVHALKSNSLFSDGKNIFIENFFSKKNKELEESINLINKNSNLNIVIWDENELSKSQLSAFLKPTIKLFKIPQSLFSFLDSIKPGNVQNVTLFYSVLKNSDENFLFSMIIRQFRLLLALRDGQNDSIDELQRLGPWQIEKLQRQSQMFTIEQLKKIYNKLYKIDLNIKTGVYPNLTSAIDILLLDI